MAIWLYVVAGLLFLLSGVFAAAPLYTPKRRVPVLSSNEDFVAARVRGANPQIRYDRERGTRASWASSITLAILCATLGESFVLLAHYVNATCIP